MSRPIAVRAHIALALGFAMCAVGVPRASAGSPACRGPATCTNEMGAVGHAAPAIRHQRVTAPGCRHGLGPGTAACGPRACAQPRCGHGGCGPQACGPCGQGACCRRHCCHGACCHELCEQIGHCLHHDVYEKRYFLRSQGKSWHSAWYDPAEGRPIALVVPPTAEFQTQYSWGVPSSRVAPIYHQFRRPYPGPGAVGGAGGGFLPTPNQPSDTVQFGVNAVRGPWGSY